VVKTAAPPVNAGPRGGARRWNSPNGLRRDPLTCTFTLEQTTKR